MVRGKFTSKIKGKQQIVLIGFSGKRLKKMKYDTKRCC
jgi:hypothetical protein